MAEFARTELAAAERQAEEARAQAQRDLEESNARLRAHIEILHKFKPPKQRGAELVQGLSKGRRSQLHSEAVGYLYEILTSEDWCIEDVSAALQGADMWQKLFETAPCQDLRAIWLRGVWKLMHATSRGAKIGLSG